MSVRAPVRVSESFEGEKHPRDFQGRWRSITGAARALEPGKAHILGGSHVAILKDSRDGRYVVQNAGGKTQSVHKDPGEAAKAAIRTHTRVMAQRATGNVSEAADSLAKASTPEPFSTSRTSNWVARVGGLPDYIQHIAHDLMEKRGKTESNAIQMAIGIVKNWASGLGKVDQNTRAAARKAWGEWVAKKSASHALQHSAFEPIPPTLADLKALQETALVRIAVLEERFDLTGLLAAGVLAEADSSWSPTLKRTASASGELERHDVQDGGQSVGMVCARRGYGAEAPTRWEARAVNGERVLDGGSSRAQALEGLRKHLEEAPARVGKHSSGKFLVARPASYSGQDSFMAYPSEGAARFAAGLPEQPSSPEKASQVAQLGEMLRFDLMTVSGLDVPPLRRVQEARRRDPFELAEVFNPGEARGFGGKWVRGGQHRFTPTMVQPMRTRSNRPKGTQLRRYEGGARSHIGSELTARMRGMFTAAEGRTQQDSQRQPSAKLDALYRVAPQRQQQFERVMAGVARRLGAEQHSTSDESAFGQAKVAISSRTDKAHVVVGGLKSHKRAKEKVVGKYEGDAGRITDLVRGTVVVPHADNLPDAVAAVRKALPAGWSLVKPENRFVHGGRGDKVHTGPMSSGYRDVSMLLRSPDGFLSELQINTTHLWVAKEVQGGHTIYEARREIAENPRGRVVGKKRQLTPEQASRVHELDAKARVLYEPAMRRSLRTRARVALR